MSTELNTTKAFAPDYAIAPGQTLLETLEAVGLSQSDLAERTGRPKKTINEIIKGKAAITAETAIQLERVLGAPAAFWYGLEQNYRAALARSEARTKLESYVDWLKSFPISDLVAKDWIKPQEKKADLVNELLVFFGVASPKAWEEVWIGLKESTAFRQSKTKFSDLGAVASWLRKGEIDGRDRECAPYNAAKFRSALTKIRKLTAGDINVACQVMLKECADAGVAVVLTPELPKLRVCGATRWLSADKALVQLSLMYKRDDQFWFSFFHEAGHILLHGKRGLYVEESRPSKDREEDEANQFAADLLIPTDEYDAFVAAGDFSQLAIGSFAKKVDISASILVGRLQHDRKIGFNERNEFHRRIDWA